MGLGPAELTTPIGRAELAKLFCQANTCIRSGQCWKLEDAAVEALGRAQRTQSIQSGPKSGLQSGKGNHCAQQQQQWLE